MIEHNQAYAKLMEGIDNYGRPRQEFADKLITLNDADFFKEAELCIWRSAYAENNSRSDYHRHADACYYEAQRRKKPELYQRAWERASGALK
jgi:hypothetical protein